MSNILTFQATMSLPRAPEALPANLDPSKARTAYGVLALPKLVWSVSFGYSQGIRLLICLAICNAAISMQSDFSLFYFIFFFLFSFFPPYDQIFLSNIDALIDLITITMKRPFFWSFFHYYSLQFSVNDSNVILFLLLLIWPIIVNISCYWRRNAIKIVSSLTDSLFVLIPLYQIFECFFLQNRELGSTDTLTVQKALTALSDMLHNPENVASSIQNGS